MNIRLLRIILKYALIHLDDKVELSFHLIDHCKSLPVPIVGGIYLDRFFKMRYGGVGILERSLAESKIIICGVIGRFFLDDIFQKLLGTAVLI